MENKKLNNKLNNKYFDELVELINSLTKSENVTAKKHLQAYRSNHTSRKDKMFQLFRTIETNSEIDIAELKLLISPNVSIKSYYKLLKRTVFRVRESLMIEVNLKRKSNYGTIFKVRYQIKKDIIVAQILLNKGLLNQALGLYTNIIRIAIEYEFFDEVIEALLIKLNIASGGNKKLDYRKIKEEIDFYELEKTQLREIRFQIQTYSAKIAKISNKDTLNKELALMVIKVKRMCINLKSYNSKSILYLLQMEYCGNLGLHNLMIKKAEALLFDLLNKPALYSQNRINYTNNEIARAYFIKLDLKQAKYFCESAIEALEGKINNAYLSSNETLIKIEIYLNEHDDVKLKLQNILNLSITKKYSLKETHFNYYLAITYFVLQNYKTSFQQLNELKIIEKDKEGWNVWIRIMRILCSIELLRLNMVDYDIESFRKYIERISKAGNINARVQLILKVLTELDRCNYNFRLVAQKRRLELENLKNTTGKYKWDIKSPEMILFHDWFEARLHNQSYQPNLEPYKKQMELDDAKPLSKAKAKKYRAMGLIE